jgi:hypothetical protein
MSDGTDNLPRLTCDAMCGGLARWLRLLGIDATFTPGIDDAELIALALAQDRILITSDGRIFERRIVASGRLRALRLPVGLPLDEQVRYVFERLALRVGPPRCTHCNGPLESVPRTDVAEVVPARSLLWATEFHRCTACGRVFWRGSHWRRIDRLLAMLPGSANADVGGALDSHAPGGPQ